MSSYFSDHDLLPDAPMWVTLSPFQAVVSVLLKGAVM